MIELLTELFIGLDTVPKVLIMSFPILIALVYFKKI
tara:strand:- start:88 stop:195 length:108 start_codon:yes stop_codon:yes gene_type:complete